jgi:hypothetical protein
MNHTRLAIMKMKHHKKRPDLLLPKRPSDQPKFTWKAKESPEIALVFHNTTFALTYT